MILSSSPTRRHVLGLMASGMVIALPSIGTHVALAPGDDEKHDGGCRGVRNGSSTPDSGVPAFTGNGLPPSDISVRYSDGWNERIVGGTYELVDPQSRLVVRRSASIEDFDRMRAVR